MGEEQSPLPPPVPGLGMLIGEFEVVPLESIDVMDGSAAGMTDDPSKTLTAAAGFLWMQLSIVSNVDFTWVLNSSNTDSDFTVDNSEIDANTFRGDKGASDVVTPIQLPVAHWFPGSTTVTAKMTTPTAAVNDVKISLLGLRVRTNSLLHDQIDQWWRANRI